MWGSSGLAGLGDDVLVLRAGRVGWFGRRGDMPGSVVDYLRDSDMARAGLEVGVDAGAGGGLYSQDGGGGGCLELVCLGPGGPSPGGDTGETWGGGWGDGTSGWGCCERAGGWAGCGDEVDGAEEWAGPEGRGGGGRWECVKVYAGYAGWGWVAGAAACVAAAQTAGSVAEGGRLGRRPR